MKTHHVLWKEPDTAVYRGYIPFIENSKRIKWCCWHTHMVKGWFWEKTRAWTRRCWGERLFLVRKEGAFYDQKGHSGTSGGGQMWVVVTRVLILQLTKLQIYVFCLCFWMCYIAQYKIWKKIYLACRKLIRKNYKIEKDRPPMITPSESNHCWHFDVNHSGKSWPWWLRRGLWS